jgi:hypothetical protein
MTLLEIIQNLAAYDNEWTIYAAEPWTPISHAIVAFEPDSGELPSETKSLGLKYLLEVFIAREFLADLDGTLSPEERCHRIIRYAIDDA